MSRNGRLVIVTISLWCSMFLLAFASVPLYNIFCKVTGFGGTTQISLRLPESVGERKITVRFDSNIDRSLDWRFDPLQSSVDVMTGESGLAFYEAENLSDQPLLGMAVYNVTPEKAGKYFHKVHCFCFEEQLLLPNQKLMMPVSFYIDPSIEKDKSLDKVDTITLSYTFFRLKAT